MKFSLLTITTILLSTNLAQADICYKDVVTVPAGTLICDENTIQTDFSSGCSYSSEDVTEKLVATCEKMWIKAPDHWAKKTDGTRSSGQICEYFGLENANFDGVVCASATNQPQTGLGFELIDHNMFVNSSTRTQIDIKLEGGKYWGLQKTNNNSPMGVCSNTPVNYTDTTWATKENEVTARVCLLP